jgi:hypothetical protein
MSVTTSNSVQTDSRYSLNNPHENPEPNDGKKKIDIITTQSPIQKYKSGKIFFTIVAAVACMLLSAAVVAGVVIVGLAIGGIFMPPFWLFIAAAVVSGVALIFGIVTLIAMGCSNSMTWCWFGNGETTMIFAVLVIALVAFVPAAVGIWLFCQAGKKSDS